MKQNLQRLDTGELEEVHRFIKRKRARRWALNHAPNIASLFVGLAFLPSAIRVGVFEIWLAIFAAFLVYFMVDAIRQERRVRAHWIAPTRPRDTGPLH